MSCSFCATPARFSASHPQAPKPLMLCGADACSARLGLKSIGAPTKRGIAADEDADPEQQPGRAFDDLGTPEQLALASDVYTQLMALDRLVDMLGRQTVSRTGVALPEGASAADRRRYEWRAEQLDSEAVKHFLLDAHSRIADLLLIHIRARDIAAPLSGPTTLAIAEELKQLKNQLRQLIQDYGANVARFSTADLRALQLRVSEIARAFRQDPAYESMEREVIDAMSGAASVLPTELRVRLATEAAGKRFPVYPLRPEPASKTALSAALRDARADMASVNEFNTVFVPGMSDPSDFGFDMHEIAVDGNVRRHHHAIKHYVDRVVPVSGFPKLMIELPPHGDFDTSIYEVRLTGAEPRELVEDYITLPYVGPDAPNSRLGDYSDNVGGRTVFSATLPADNAMYFASINAAGEYGLYRLGLRTDAADGGLSLGGYTRLVRLPEMPTDGAVNIHTPEYYAASFMRRSHARIAVSDARDERTQYGRGAHYVAVSGLNATKGPTNDAYSVRVFMIIDGQIIYKWDFTHVVPKGVTGSEQMAIDESGAVLIMTRVYRGNNNRFRATVYRHGGAMTVLDAVLPARVQDLRFLRVDTESVPGYRFLSFLVMAYDGTGAIWRYAI